MLADGWLWAQSHQGAVNAANATILTLPDPSYGGWLITMVQRLASDGALFVAPARGHAGTLKHLRFAS